MKFIIRDSLRDTANDRHLSADFFSLGTLLLGPAANRAQRLEKVGGTLAVVLGTRHGRFVDVERVWDF